MKSLNSLSMDKSLLRIYHLRISLLLILLRRRISLHSHTLLLRRRISLLSSIALIHLILLLVGLIKWLALLIISLHLIGVLRLLLLTIIILLILIIGILKRSTYISLLSLHFNFINNKITYNIKY